MRNILNQINRISWRRCTIMVSVFFICGGLVASAADINQDLADKPIQAIRFEQNPVITPKMGKGIGTDINGPSLIKVPAWLPNRLGKYYLYFAHHTGTYIRLAYADKLEGPWKIYEPGVLDVKDTTGIRGGITAHIASPDVHVDNDKREIRMYFHGPSKPSLAGQVSLVATSKDGLHFKQNPTAYLGDCYFRVFQWNGQHYALSRTGTVYRSVDGLTKWEKSPVNPFGKDSRVRHVAVKIDGNILSVFYSRIGDTPERILLSKIELTPDWTNWAATEPVTVLEPEMEYEGVDLPLKPSILGDATERVRELRDPAIYQEGGRVYLLYSVAGESGIAIAELKEGAK